MTDAPTTTSPATDHATHNGHVRSLITIYIWLMILLVATVAAALVPWFHVGSFNIVIAMAIAITKAVLVIWIFMHVKYSGRLVWIFAVAAFVWLGIMLSLTFTDYLTRSRLPRADDQLQPAELEHSPLRHETPQPHG
ncbi:MAG: cytochrome C oxidase subunit IV family protein [Anaerolineae bacterium]|nr:cytochrome C oxidase subunit IV family protein [Phycisphaerae bacterium]